MNFTVQWHETLPSTNSFLKEQIAREPGLPDGTVIAARRQTAGKGRHGRTWISAGENLTFSVFVRGALDRRRMPSSGMAAAAAVAELLEAEGVPAALKWPNDVMAGGKKICGILAESVAGGVIIGIGLNVNMENATPIAQPATSILMETGRRRDVSRLLDALLPYLSARLEAWRDNGFAALRAEWEKRAANKGRAVTVRDGKGTQTGVFAGFGADGELLLQTGDGSVNPVWSGDFSV